MSSSDSINRVTTTGAPQQDVLSNLATLLTEFTPSATCTDEFVYNSSYSGTVWSDWDDAKWITDCWPQSSSAFHPGVCPSGQEFKNVNVYVETFSSLTSSFYTGYCCNSNYEWDVIGSSCFSEISTTVVAYLTPTTSGGPWDQFTTLSPALVASAQPLTMYWYSTDLSLFDATIRSSLEAAMGPQASSTSTSTLAWNGDLPSDSGPALSKGAIAGISVGAAVVFLLLVGLGFLALRRRWTNTKDQETTAGKSWHHRFGKSKTPDVPPTENGTNISDEYQAVPAWPAELQNDGPQKAELQGGGVPMELPNDAVAHQKPPSGDVSPHSGNHPTSMISSLTDYTAVNRTPVEIDGSERPSYQGPTHS
ncbi:hypothetical protein F4778DRAFT_50028 [Xylariomycetidae sp. FL2044]|nr:hypothetical protein F4778DRAFT_50028 [Xylariomycetidae sp. FL2044]